ncbi:ABC transporter ATP-binding protein [Undibacterium sp. SXout11W]|uniref:ABC transporter ATP-binding protein n=1 Tax=Undibacterium sp. SXout11W TaxID=3413050 RepID=UPI003BF2698B
MNSGKIESEARKDDYVIQMQQICTRFGEKIVHDGVDLQVRRGDIFAIVGGSGSGKSTLLREMILLHKPDSGSVKILGMDLADISEPMTKDLRQRCGVLFQKGGLFGTLTVSENIGLPLREHTDLDDVLIDQVALWKLAQTGLQPESASLYPAELSGGMLKRAAMARALALDPELLFLDEPTAGLDPTSADGIDTLILQLHAVYRPTIVMITHDLDLLWQVTHQVAVLGGGKVLAVGSMMELSQLENPEIRAYFDGARGRAAQEQAGNLAANHAINVNDKKVPAWKPK